MKKYEKNEKLAMHKVFQECAHAMRVPLFMSVLSAVLTAVLGMVTADTLGKFADAAFALDFSMGVENAVSLVVCLVFVIFAVPAVGMFSDFIMFQESLRHDSIVFGHYLDKRIEKAMALKGGEMQYELEDAPNTLRIQWVRLLGKAVALPLCLIYFLYCVGKISWTAAGLMLAITAAKLVVPMLFKQKLARYDREEKIYQAKRRDCESDIMTRPYMIKLWGILQGAIERIDGLFQKYYRGTAVCHVNCSVLAEQMQTLVNQVSIVVMLFAGAVMVSHSTVTLGESASLFLYLTVAQALLNDIGEIVQNYPLLRNAAERVCTFYQDEETVSEKTVAHFEDLLGEQLGFSYADKKVFDLLDFRITAGEKVRICGENGKGKTTLIRILGTMLERYEGSLLMSGQDFRSIDKESWRKIISYAPQTPFLFHGTVRENITVGGSHSCEEKADRLMKAFGIYHLADQSVDGDSDLSGGERQKISLARALLKESEVLILDEPSNHLDQKSIYMLKKYLCETDKTVLFITHDTALLDVAERCIEL